MEKSNETPKITDTGAMTGAPAGTQPSAGALVDKNLLIIVTRRLDISKQFFAWVIAVYFFATLCSIGGLWVEIFAPVARLGLGLVVFAAGALLYSLIAYGCVIQGGMVAKLRFVALFGIVAFFGFALAKIFALI